MGGPVGPEKFRFGFERRDAYQVARTDLDWVHHALFPRLPRGYAEERDHLRRASLSIMLNVAEGAQQESRAVKRRHFQIAKGSAGECAAVLDALGVLGVELRVVGRVSAIVGPGRGRRGVPGTADASPARLP